VLREGGHIAEVFDVRAGINPLWAPPWTSVDPSLCDFGDPSPAEAIVGLTTHGEGSLIPYEIVDESMALTLRADLHLAPLHFERRIELRGRAVRIAELVKNLSSSDRPIAWTQHVTLGPPFPEKGSTEFRSSMT